MDHTDMPTVDDLRATARRAFEKLRTVDFCARSMSDLAFAERELRTLGDVLGYAQEFRRHELIQRGYTPPEDLDA